MTRPRLLTLALSTAALSGAAGHASAQSLDEKLRAQLRTVVGQLRDVQNSQATLQAQKAAAEQERDALKAKLAAGGGRPAPRRVVPAPSAPPAELARLRDENVRLTQAAQQAQADATKYKDAYTEAVQSVSSMHAQQDRLRITTDQASTTLAACEAKNIQAVKVGRDVIAAYTRVGLTEVLKKKEPFTGLERVKLERMAQEYGDRVYEAKFDPRAVRTGGSRAANAASNAAVAATPVTLAPSGPQAPPPTPAQLAAPPHSANPASRTDLPTATPPAPQ